MSGRDRVTVVGTDTGGGVVIVGILAAAAIFLVLFSIFADRIYSDPSRTIDVGAKLPQVEAPTEP